MSPLPWTGATEQAHRIRIVYQSGEAQIWEWVRDENVQWIASAIPEAREEERKRQGFLAAYHEAGASDDLPDVILLHQLDARKRLHTVLSWGLAWEMFDVPSLTGTRLRSFYPYDLDRVEILASQTVTAVP